MLSRISKRDLLRAADINATEATHASYFCFLEYTERVAYCAGIYGWSGNLFRGCDSGLYYAVTDYGNENGTANRLIDELGEREKYVIRTLASVKELEHSGAGYSVMRYLSNDGRNGFTIATHDFGHTWQLVG